MSETMSDIFISYANQDRDRIKLLAASLAETQGWSVWWDREIPFGKPDKVIEEALKNARCILVAWSTHAVTSGWVIDEAQYGRDRETLVPVLIDDVAIPFDFRRIQSAYLVDWNGKGTSAVFQKLVSDIAAIVGASPKIHYDTQRKPIYTSAAKAAMIKAFYYDQLSDWKAKYLMGGTAIVLGIVLSALLIVWLVDLVK